MKKLFTVLVLLMSFNVTATCDFKSVKKVGADTFIYTKECHLEVGKLVKVEKIRKGQVADLNKSITLKDLAITKADARISLWKDTTYKLEDRMLKQRKYSRLNNTLIFGSGVLTVILSAWAMGQLR